MKGLAAIQQQLGTGQFEFSRHAFRRAVERNISEQEIREAGAHMEVIENYPDDKYSPSALLQFSFWRSADLQSALTTRNEVCFRSLHVKSRLQAGAPPPK